MFSKCYASVGLEHVVGTSTAWSNTKTKYAQVLGREARPFHWWKFKFCRKSKVTFHTSLN